MTEAQFLAKVKDCYLHKKDDKKSYSPYGSDYIPLGEKVNETLEHYIINEWTSGGISGGSSFEGGSCSCSPTEGEERPDFSDLDNILDELCPKITYVQFRELFRDVVKCGSYTERGYYGDGSVYSQEVIKLRDLYNALKKRKLI